MTGVHVTELHTQDGWDWPNGVGQRRLMHLRERIDGLMSRLDT